jgi:ribosomal-protein-alanine acetyltransferase
MSGARTRRFFGKGRRIVSDEPHTGSSNPTVRKMLPSDALAIHQLLQEAPEAANWTEDTIRSSLRSDQILAFVSERDKEIQGCIFGARVADEAEILNLAAKLQHRRKGIARALVLHILSEWQRQNVLRVFLEVRESNSGAICFYTGLGFQQVGRRKKYYAEPEEDALVLERSSTQTIPSNPQIGTR